MGERWLPDQNRFYGEGNGIGEWGLTEEPDRTQSPCSSSLTGRSFGKRRLILMESGAVKESLSLLGAPGRPKDGKIELILT